MEDDKLVTEAEVCAACSTILGELPFYSREEREQLHLSKVPEATLEELLEQMRSPEQDLESLFEEWLCAIRSRSQRHEQGMVFTPEQTVRQMITRIEPVKPDRIIDCGCGAGRFALQAAELCARQHDVEVIAFDIDPLACLLTHTAAQLLSRKVNVRREDFIQAEIGPESGVTAFIGNPPYIRHHDMSPQQKEWGHELASAVGIHNWSRLAGMHAIFIAKCLHASKPGDVMCFLTGAEWLDVNYGAALREAFASDIGGGRELILYAPDAELFEGVLSTALISLWKPRDHHENPVSLTYISADGTSRQRPCPIAEMRNHRKWSELGSRKPNGENDGLVELSTLFRISRGIVTGSNGFFLMKRETVLSQGLEAFFVPVIARASDLPKDGLYVERSRARKMLLSISGEDIEKNSDIAAYIALGEAFGVHKGHVTSHRKNWWHITYTPAPILATYMTRDKPRFALNPEGMPNLNTVHGLYPRQEMSSEELEACVMYLNTGQLVGDGGRIYQGGLRKYEPREMGRIKVPPLEAIVRWSKDGR